jgi:uncharacterized protein (DUF433 family)
MDYPHVVCTPETCAGQPRIDGTRITVNLIAREVVHQRWTPEEVLMAHPHLTLAQIHAALAYYFDHQSEIEGSIRNGDALEGELRAKYPSKLAARLTAQP